MKLEAVSPCHEVGQCVIGKLEDSDAEVRQGAVDFLYYAAKAGPVVATSYVLENKTS